MGWAYDPEYEERLKRRKEERPDCPYTKNGKHTWNEWGSIGVKECHDCGYKEDIVIPR